MGSRSIIWPLLQYQQQQAGQNTAGQVLMNYPWQQGGGGPQAPQPGQSSQPQAQPASYTPSRGPSGPPDWNTKGAPPTVQAMGGGDLPTMVGRLESDSGRANYRQPPGMADPTYGQFPGFAKQYGSGPQGVTNFANAVLKAKPDATVGDFYASYVLGTGTPGQYNINDLKSKYPAAYNNFMKNGVDPNTSLSQMLKKGGGGGISSSPQGQVTPASINMSRMLAPAAPQMSLEGIVQTAKRINPNISGQELYATVSALMPIMSRETQDQFKVVQLQMKEMQLEQQEQRIQDQEHFGEERQQLNQEKQQEKERVDQEKLQLQKEKMGMVAQKWDDQKKQFQEKFDQAEEKLKSGKDIQEKRLALQQAYQAKNQALRAKGEAIAAASNISDPDLRKQFIDQANADYDEAEQRYKDFSAAYQSEFENGPSSSGGTVESRKTEEVGKPENTDKSGPIGSVMTYKGKKYRFKGGDWNKQSDWEEVGSAPAGPADTTSPSQQLGLP